MLKLAPATPFSLRYSTYVYVRARAYLCMQLLVCTSIYHYLQACTKVKTLYRHARVRISTYRYVRVRTILPDPVQVHMIQDEQ